MREMVRPIQHNRRRVKGLKGAEKGFDLRRVESSDLGNEVKPKICA